MKQLNIAIIGQGRSGRNIHGKHFLTDLNRFKVVAIVEEIAQRRERAKEEHECEVYENYEALFGRTDIDFIINATRSHDHAKVTIDLLNHGFNVVVEKPASKKVEEVDAMIEAATSNQKMLAVFQQSRFAPYFRKVKDVIESGCLGRLVQITIKFNGYARRWDWQCCQDMYGGNLLNTGPHPLDQALNLLDDYDNLPSIFCKMDRSNTFGDAEDYVKLIMTAPDKPLVDLEISSSDPYSSFTYHIQGTRGGLKGSTEAIEWKYFKKSEAKEQKLIRRPLEDKDGYPVYCSEKLNWYEEKWQVEDAGLFSHAVRDFYTTIYEHLVEGKDLVVTMKEVRQQVEVIEECHRQNPLETFSYEEE